MSVLLPNSVAPGFFLTACLSPAANLAAWKPVYCTGLLEPVDLGQLSMSESLVMLDSFEAFLAVDGILTC